MRRMIMLLGGCVSVMAWGAAPPLEGRWEGLAQIPGRPLPVVVDLSRNAAGTWIGSIIVPGLGVKGAPLAHIVVSGTELAFDIDKTLGNATRGPATFNMHLVADAAMAGEMRQAGNAAALSLKRTGQAQVELPLRSTAVSRDIEDQWTGDVEFGGYPRHVTITLANRDNAGATGKFLVVGKQSYDFPVDLVTQEGDVIRIESQSSQVAFEGRFVKEAGEIRGNVELGATELPLVLRRVSGRAS